MGAIEASGRHARHTAVIEGGPERTVVTGGNTFGRSLRSGLRQGVLRPVKDCGRRLLERIENRRAEALRRKPAGVARRLRAARSVLILCQGNVIRSVYAAELLGTGLRDKRSVAIQSAGLATEPGWQAHPRVIARCRELGVDVTSHGSKAVTEAMVRAADVVLVMEIRQILAIIRRFPVVRRKTFLLTCLAPDVPIEIADPAGRDDASVDACLDHVVRAVTPMIDALAGSDGAPA